MTPQEIIENNILLAEFMGWEFNTDFGMFYVPIEKEEYNADVLKFHDDWTWLMLVVDEIKHISETERMTSIEFLCAIDTNDFDRIYTSCIEFVKWFNQNKGGN